MPRADLCFPKPVFFAATRPSPHLLSCQTELPPTAQTCFKPLPCSYPSSCLDIYLPSPPSKPYLPFRVMSPCSILQERRSLHQEGLYVALIVLLPLVSPACLYLIDVSICPNPPTPWQPPGEQGICLSCLTLESTGHSSLYLEGAC